MDADQENVVSAAFGLCTALLGAGVVPGSLGMLLSALLPSCCGRIFKQFAVSRSQCFSVPSGVVMGLSFVQFERKPQKCFVAVFRQSVLERCCETFCLSL